MPEIGGNAFRGVLVEKRFVPFPKSISPQARAALADFAAAAAAEPRRRDSYPVPDDLSGWVALIEATNAKHAAMIAPLVKDSVATVEVVEMNGVTVYLATPEKLSAESERRAYLHVHGGALIFGGGEVCRLSAPLSADRFGVRSYSVDYRVAPNHPYPAALDDCIGVYRALLESYTPANIIVGGISAGGNLAAALTLRARDEGLPLPAAMVLITPELDLTESGDSFEVNRDVDVVLIKGLAEINALYAGGANLTDPYLSPLFGNFTEGFPPTFLQAGTRDLFLSNVVRMHRTLRRARVPVELHIFEGMPHGGFSDAPEDDDLWEEVKRFVAEHWGLPMNC
jgi:epsilon-lactone hydrolase